MKIFLSKYLLPITDRPIQDAALVIQKDRIVEVGKSKDLLAKYPEAEKIEFEDSVLMPGLVNAHCHLELSEAPHYQKILFQDLSGESNFVRWLISTAQYQQKLTPTLKAKAIEKGIKELKNSGVTCVGDLTTYEGAHNLYEKSGLRVTAFPEVLNIHQKNSQEQYESAMAQIDELMALDNHKIKAGLAPFAAYTLSKNLLKIFVQHVKQLQIPVQIHSSFSFAEMEFFYDSKGDIANILFPYIGWTEKLPPPHQKTPIQFLHSIDFLQLQPALVGCTHLGPTDLGLVAQTQSKVICCPNASKTLESGSVPLAKLYKSKIHLALGSESRACNSSLNLWDDLKLLWEESQKSSEKIPASYLLQCATLGGARALGLNKTIGSLEKDKLADFIIVKQPRNVSLETIEEKLLENSNQTIMQSFVGGVEL